MTDGNIRDLVNNMLAGEQDSLARLITIIEQDGPKVTEIFQLLPSNPYKKAYRIGITGPPGAGKSTLIDKLVTAIRSRGFSIGVIAVDPSSAITGGAVLGDRIRMRQHYSDKGVFIRSIATRGSWGGVSKSVPQIADLMDSSGKDIVLIETTGVGQNEVGITEVADIVVVVMVPGLGDNIQLMKAGLVEIADIVVINKADLEGAENFAFQVREQLGLSPRKVMPPIIITEAVNNMGIEELYQELDRHWKMINCNVDEASISS